MKTSRINVTDELIAELITRVAPLVEQETGWDLALSTLKSKALPKNRGYEEILLGRLQSAGITIDEDSPRFLIERLVELVLEANIYAAYDPGTQTIYMIRENVDDSNLHGMMVILAHELVHRGQHIQHPEMFARADAVIREIYADLINGVHRIDEESVMEKIQSMQSSMTLMESHATFVQQQITARYFPDAQIETHFNLMSLFFRLAGGAKISQYTQGLPEIARAVRNGQIDSLYQNR